jgi:hypothetical protein
VLGENKLLILLMSLFLVACSDDIDIVQNGVMSFNKSITVGQAFNNWRACKSNDTWHSFKTANGRRVVEFVCDKKNVKKLVKSLKVKKEFIITSIKETYQWIVNQDDSFQANNIQTETIWADGKKLSFPEYIVKNFNERFKMVYNNNSDDYTGIISYSKHYHGLAK